MDKSLRTLLTVATGLWTVAAALGFALVAGAALTTPAHAAGPAAAPGPGTASPTSEVNQQVRALAQQAGRRLGGTDGVRVDVEVGELDPRLRLAPCDQVQPYLPQGSRAWGRTRVGLRCVRGPVRWNVFLPVTVRVMAPGLVAVAALPAGTVLSAADLRVAEVDLAAGPSPAVTRGEAAVGRTLARGVDAGAPLQQADLRARQFFQAGDTVQVVAVGNGYQVSSEARALGPGLEGQSVKLRTDSGRIVTGVAAGDRRVEILL